MPFQDTPPPLDNIPIGKFSKALAARWDSHKRDAAYRAEIIERLELLTVSGMPAIAAIAQSWLDILNSTPWHRMNTLTGGYLSSVTMIGSLLVSDQCAPETATEDELPAWEVLYYVRGDKPIPQKGP